MGKLVYSLAMFHADLAAFEENSASFFSYEGVYGIPSGGIPFAMALSSIADDLPLCTDRDEALSNPNILVVDDVLDSGGTMEPFIENGNPTLVIHSKNRHHPAGYLHEIEPRTWIDYWWENTDSGPEDAVVRLLQYIGEDPNREGLVETPKRVLKAYKAFFAGYDQKPEEVLKTFTEGACDEMVILKDIEFYSTCEHHMVPFAGKAHIAYIPDGKVVGVSKLARLLEVFARRLQIQERIGDQITSALMEHLKCKGAACILEAQHMCMTARGVEKQNSVMVTSSLKGVFLDKPECRAEFMGIVQK